MTSATVNDQERGSLQWRRQEIFTQLDCLGYTKADPVYLRCVSTRPDRKTFPLTFPANNPPIHKLVKAETDGYNVFITYNGGGHKKSEVTHRRAFVSESDTVTVEEQVNQWWKVQLPEPTLMIFSGNKSVHQYWCLDRLVAVDDETDLVQTRIIRALDSDTAMMKAEQPLRLAGFAHPKTGNFAECLPLVGGYESRMVYTLQNMKVMTQKHATKEDKNKKTDLVQKAIEYTGYVDYVSASECLSPPTKRVSKVLDSEVTRCKLASEGTRNTILTSASFTIGAISGEHSVDVAKVCTKLCKVIQSWPDTEKTYDTFERQFYAGLTAGKVKRGMSETSTKDEFYSLYDMNPYSPKVFNSRYIGDNIDITQKGVHIIISPMGTGKTVTLQQIKDKQSIVSLTYRSTLEYAQTRPVEQSGLGLTSVSRGVDSGRQVCCTDSIHKLFEPSQTQYLILDEFFATLEHTITSTGTTVRDERTAKFNALCDLIRNTPTVVVAGADLSTVEVDFILSLRNDVTVYVNEYKAPSTTPLTMVRTANELINRLHLDVSNGRKVYVSTDSKGKAAVITEDIKRDYPGLRVLEISSVTSGLTEVVRFLRDPSTECVNYDVVIASPTAQTGVDISGHHFQSVYGWFTNWGLDYKGLNQGLSRVRNPECMTVFLAKSFNSEDTPEVGPYQYDEDETVSAHVVMHDLYSKMKHRHNTLRSLTTITHMSNELCERNGFSLTPSSDMGESVDYTERYKQLRDELRQEYIGKVVTSPVWGEDDVARYRAGCINGAEITPDMRYAYDKYKYTSHLNAGRPDFELATKDVEFAVNGGVRHLLNYGRSLMWTEDMTMTSDFVDVYWDKKHQTFHIDRSRNAQRSALIRKVLLDSGILVRHTDYDNDGYASHYITTTCFTEASTAHILGSADLYEGFTQDLCNGNAVKTGLTLVKTCLEAVGISVESHRTRNADGTQTREYRPSIMDIALMEGTYYSESKYPWKRVCDHYHAIRSFSYQGGATDSMREALLRVWQLGMKRGYYTGPKRSVY